MDTALQEFLGGGIVHMVGGDDRHRLDAVLQLGLADRHLLEVGIDPRRIKPELAAGAFGLVRRRRQGAGHQFVVIVEPGGDAVHRADEGARTAADHAEPDPPLALLARSLDCHRFVSLF